MLSKLQKSFAFDPFNLFQKDNVNDGKFKLIWNFNVKINNPSRVCPCKSA